MGGIIPEKLAAYWWDPRRSVVREFAIRGPMWWSLLRAAPKLRNFGDSVNPLILRELTGRSIAWAQLGQEDVVCIGSTLNSYLLNGGRGAILGTGVRQPETLKSGFPVSRVLGVRGQGTARAIGVKDEAVIGDPGLLISEVFAVRERGIEAPAFVPHLRMFGNRRGHALLSALSGAGYTIIPPNEDPADVARKVAKASSVLATSLHALVFADSYAIPCARLDVPWLNEPLFKFDDYRSVFRIGLASVSIEEALTGAKIDEIADEERQVVASRLRGILDGVYAAARPLRQ